jgi:hypothetical protein
MFEEPDGEWVSYEDAQAEIERFKKHLMCERHKHRVALFCSECLSELHAEIVALKKENAMLKDAALGTPCAQIRHAQEIEALKSEIYHLTTINQSNLEVSHERALQRNMLIELLDEANAEIERLKEAKK